MDIATLIGLVAGFTLVLVAIGNNLSIFIDIPSLLIVVGGTIAVTLVSFPLPDVVGFIGYVMHAFLPTRADADREKAMREMEKGILMLGRMKTYAQAMGWIGVLVGAVIMLKNVDDPAALGPGAALMLLTALYGTIIAFMICWPLRTKLEVYLDELKNE